MANLNLPVQGEEPWDSKLNAAVAAVNTEVETTTAVLTTGRLSGTNLSNSFAEKSVQDTVQTGRLSTDQLNITFGDDVLLSVKADGTDEAASIQAQLAALPAGRRARIPFRGTGVVTISAGVIAFRDKSLILSSGVTLKRKSGSFGNLVRFGGTGSTDYSVGGGFYGDPGSVVDGADNSGAAATTARHHLLVRFARGFTWGGWTSKSTAGKYANCLGAVDDFDVLPIRMACYSDGLHLNGPATNGRIGTISGTSGDDLLSLTSTDYATYNDVEGDITDIVFDDIIGDSGGTAAFKIATSATTRVDRIRGGRIINTKKRIAFSIANDTGTINVGTVEIAAISGYGYTATGGKFDSLIVGSWAHPQRTEDPTAAAFTVACDFNLIDISNPQLDTPLEPGAFLLTLPSAGLTGDTIILRGGRIRMPNKYGIYIVGNSTTTNTVRRVIVDGVRRAGPTGGGLVRTDTGGSLGEIHLVDADSTDSSWLAQVGGPGTVELFMRGCRGNVLLNSSTFVREAGGGTIATGATLGGSVRSMSFDFKVDVGLLTRAAHDRAYNTNASRACGVGPVICDGTTWKHIYTGATYTP